ncbi:MAG: hypothetical protein GXP16_04665 [Gammaproteobacteria bacterium]|nr:hypothetical protein [Gammaproteobacteria bacterium]
MTQHILQISDCHLVMSGTTLLGVDTQASLEAVLQQATQDRQPQAIIASGDLAHDPVREVYMRFLETLRRYSDAPLICLPGNHDVLGVMQTVGLPMQMLNLGCWSIVWLDSHEDQLPRAQVTAADCAAVVRAIEKARGQYLLVATHHPFMLVDSPWLDKDRIQKPAELVDWLAECGAVLNEGAPRLRGVVFGHAHQSIEGFCGSQKVPVFGVPSTCFQFQPGSEVFSIDAKPPGYRWLHLAENGDITTHVERVVSFPINVQLDN